MLRHLKLLIAVVLMAALSACSLLPDSGTTEALTVNYMMSKATTRIVDGDAARAERVLEAVEDARRYVKSSDTVTIGDLHSGALEYLQSLDPADRHVITAILDNARARLETAISADRLDERERVSLLDTLDWIERAARIDPG